MRFGLEPLFAAVDGDFAIDVVYGQFVETFALGILLQSFQGSERGNRFAGSFNSHSDISFFKDTVYLKEDNLKTTLTPGLVSLMNQSVFCFIFTRFIFLFFAFFAYSCFGDCEVATCFGLRIFLDGFLLTSVAPRFFFSGGLVRVTPGKNPVSFL